MSSSAAVGQKDFDAYLRFKESFWEKFSQDIIHRGNPPLASYEKSTRIGTVWKRGPWKCRRSSYSVFTILAIRQQNVGGG